MKRIYSLLSVSLLIGLSGCLPMTFSHDGEIDFTQYSSVYVQPIELTGDAVFSDLDTATQRYLVDELKSVSGFTQVTDDPNVATDAVLVVRLRVDQDYEYRNDREYRTYSSSANFTLRTQSGTTIVSSDVSDDNEELRESQEDALDEVAHFFLAPYRI